MFIHGSGEMQIDLERFTIQAGDIILIEDNEFHRVYNTTNKDLYFVCVFDGGRNH
jgi:mannose-6-phosphate isomerase-like protein (cupin superfamily)